MVFFTKATYLSFLLLVILSFCTSKSMAQRQADAGSHEKKDSVNRLKRLFDIKQSLISRSPQATQGSRNHYNTNLSSTCPPNIDFEEGTFNHWTLDTGFVRGVDGVIPSTGANFYSIHGPSTTGLNQVVMTNTPPMPNRHEIIANAGVPAPLDFYGGFSTNPPDGSGFAIKLGSDLDYPGYSMPMARAERATYVIDVPSGATDYSITYQYAVVFQDPGHVPENQPRFTVNLYDAATGISVPCGFVKYVADSTIPGFLQSPIDPNIWYKAWTPVFINLSNYTGHTLMLEFTTEDCAQGGHWGYAYLDVNGCQLAATANNSCNTPPVTHVEGPPGFQHYNWWNHDYTQLLATTQNGAISPALPNNDSLHLELVPFSGASCRDTLTVKVTRDTLIINHENDKVICSDSTVNLGTSAIVPGCTYTWTSSFPIINPQQPGISVHPLSTTDFMLTVTDTLTGCRSYDTVRVRVNPLPVLSTVGASYCRGGNASLSVSGADMYQWSPATGLNTINGPDVIASPLVTTTYTITGFVDSSSCSTDTTVTVTVNDIPVAQYSVPAPQCQTGNLFQFASASTIAPGNSIQCNWYLDGVLSSTATTFSHIFTTPGNHAVQLVVLSNHGCNDTVTQQITVYPTPQVTLQPSGPTSFCSGSNVTLTIGAQPGAPNITQYQWYNGSVPLAAGNASSIQVNQSGNFQVQVTDANGCSAYSNTQTVSVYPLPQGAVSIPSQQYICEGTPVPIAVNGNGSTYQWYLNNNLIGNGTQPVFQATQPGNYTVQVTSAQGCVSWASGNVSLSIFRKPYVNFTFPITCERMPVIFTNHSDTSASGPLTWSWDFGDGATSTTYNPVHAYNQSMSYTATLTATPLNCPSLVTASSVIVPVSAPVAGIRYPIMDAVPNVNTPLHARAIGNRYLWRPTVGLSNSGVRDPIFRFNQPMEYQIRITAPDGCVTVDTLPLRMQPAIDIQVPTAFTPNGDGHNDRLDVFLIGIGELKFFRVFNRWGQLLFETHDPRQLWDGTFHGQKQPAETYVWTAQGTGADGKDVIRRGQTILIR